MNDIEFKEHLRKERLSYGISQGRLSYLSGITRQYLNEIETGKSHASDSLKEKLLATLNLFSYDTPLFLLIDYLRVRFPTTDAEETIRNILQIKPDYLLHEDYAFYGYKEQYSHGDITLMASQDDTKGLLLELKGKGCRQLETFLQAQNRDWYEFLQVCINAGGIIKRLDLAVNDVAGLLNVPLLIEKCSNGELLTRSRKWEAMHAGALSSKVKRDRDKGSTLYIGSRSSSQYFCLYQKDKEQKNKHIQTDIKNRFEIRLTDKKAEKAVRDLLETRSPEQVVFTIINRQIRFIDCKTDTIDPIWEWFTGKDRKPIELEMRAEPYTMERTVEWLKRQAAPSLVTIHRIEEQNGTHLLEEILKQAKLKEAHRIRIKQMTTVVEDMIDTAVPQKENNGIF